VLFRAWFRLFTEEVLPSKASNSSEVLVTQYNTLHINYSPDINYHRAHSDRQFSMPEYFDTMMPQTQHEHFATIYNQLHYQSIDSSRLRDEQDREYREAEEADRRAREQRELDEMARARQQEEERQQKELDEAMELSRQLSKEDRLQRKRSSLGQEPASGSQDISTIRFQLPKGVKTSRRFQKTDKIEVSQCAHFDISHRLILFLILCSTP
jgi:hypothetical protein